MSGAQLKLPHDERLREAAHVIAMALGIREAAPEELLAHIKETLYGERKGWLCFSEQILTDTELRDLVLARYESFLEGRFHISVSSRSHLTPELIAVFDGALFGAPAAGQFHNSTARWNPSHGR